MRFFLLPLLAQAALSTSFLIPPEFSDAELKLLLNIPAMGVHPSVSNIIRLPCTGCDYKEKGVETDLILEFAETPAGNAVTLNNHPLLPPPRVPVMPTPYRAAQIPRDVDTLVYVSHKERFPMVQIDDQLMIGEHRSPDGRKEYRVELSIPAVAQKKVQLNDVKLTVFEDVDGHFVFGDSTIVPHSQTCGMNIKCMMRQMMSKIPRPGLPSSLRRPCGKHMTRPHHNLQHSSSPHHKHPHHHNARPHSQSLLQPLLSLASLALGALILVPLIAVLLDYVFVRMFSAGKKYRGFLCRRRRERARLVAEEEGLLTSEDAEIESPPAYKDEVVEEKGMESEGLEVVVEKD